jgi:hypothetical protein
VREDGEPDEEWNYVNQGRIFTPPTGDRIIAKPGTFGGANWPGSGFNPRTGHLYVCASNHISIFSTSEEEFQPRRIRGGHQFLGSAFASPSGGQLKGTFTAMDIATNRSLGRRSTRTATTAIAARQQPPAT